jgi:hypothetical protein
MSLKLKHEVRALERKVAELGFNIESVNAMIDEHLKRLETIEQRKKPGPKPKNNRNSGDAPQVHFSVADSIDLPVPAAVKGLRDNP